MANILPMTTGDLLDAIHSKYEQATDTPALTDDDGITRMRLINEGIATWEFTDEVHWRELWVYNASFGPIVAGTVQYSLTSLTDFREIGSRIRFLRTDGSKFYVDVVSQEEYARHINQNRMVVCITGNNASGYKMNLGWVPLANDGTAGATAYFDYYKHANKMVNLTDVPELSNPYFLIDYVTAELFVNDDVNLYTKFNADAVNKMNSMRAMNDSMPPYASTVVEDLAGDNTYAMG